MIEFDKDEMKFIEYALDVYCSDMYLKDSPVTSSVLSKVEELINNMRSIKMYKVLYTYNGEHYLSSGFYESLEEYNTGELESGNTGIELIRSTMVEHPPRATKYLITPTL